MDDELLIVKQISSTTSLCISTLSRRSFAEAGGQSFASDRGYFLYERDDRPGGNGISILAKLPSLEAAFHLADLWQFEAT
ncbi:MAG: hypothetical protein V2I43_02570 [Parvularcula sp.]|jgi:hypothetical protein|nr:hypothetical protein [Parvularcula sp.]